MAVKVVWLRDVSYEQVVNFELSVAAVPVPMGLETRRGRPPCQWQQAKVAWSGQARLGSCERCCRPLPRKEKARAVLCRRDQGRQGPVSDFAISMSG